MRDSLSTKQTVQIFQHITFQCGEKAAKTSLASSLTMILVLTLPTNADYWDLTNVIASVTKLLDRTRFESTLELLRPKEEQVQG